ncbi:MAG: hypothetical protein WBA93_12645 [Microcoleaceae cyanobacterium]
MKWLYLKTTTLGFVCDDFLLVSLGNFRVLSLWQMAVFKNYDVGVCL